MVAATQDQNKPKAREDVEKVVQELQEGWETLRTKAKVFSFYADCCSKKDGVQLQVLKDNLVTLANLFDAKYRKVTHYNKHTNETYVERYFYLRGAKLFSMRGAEREGQDTNNWGPDIEAPNSEQEEELLRTEIAEAVQKVQRSCKYFLEQTNCLSVYVSQVHNLELRVHMLSEDLHKLAAQINEDINMNDREEREYFYIKGVKFFAVPGVTQK